MLGCAEPFASADPGDGHRVVAWCHQSGHRSIGATRLFLTLHPEFGPVDLAGPEKADAAVSVDSLGTVDLNQIPPTPLVQMP